ncbi:hypothetical protein [Paludisphaera sp.]|uniref:hypothetical protein n=1 Tax=Paludisphaera sp. TaxID=2017432 RepID=UPI00301DE37B
MSWREVTGTEVALAVAGLCALVALATAHVGAGVAIRRLRRSRLAVTDNAGAALAQSLVSNWDVGHDLVVTREFARQVGVDLVPVLLRHPDRDARLYTHGSSGGAPAHASDRLIPFCNPSSGDPSLTLLALVFGELGFLRDPGGQASPTRAECVVAVANVAAIALAARAALANDAGTDGDRRKVFHLAEVARDVMRELVPATDPRLPVEGQEVHSTDRAAAPVQVVPDEGYHRARHLARIETALGIAYRPPTANGGQEFLPALVSIAPRPAPTPEGRARTVLGWLNPVLNSEGLVTSPASVWRMAVLPVACLAVYLITLLVWSLAK